MHNCSINRVVPAGAPCYVRLVESVTGIAERRRHILVPSHDAAWMRLVDSWSAARSEIRVLDASRGGLKLRVPKFLNRGTLVQIHLKGLASAGLLPESLLAVAEVRYCLSAGDGFHIGVVFHEIFPEGN